MRDFLILKLQSPMQAWGEHTFEGLRPSANFPTRSGLLGLLGACLGIRRNEPDRQQQLADSIGIAVRQDYVKDRQILKITDYHTVRNARADYTGKERPHETIQTWREYLLDAHFTVAVWNHTDAVIRLDDLELAVKQPFFTPFLGRRSCPISRPLFETRMKAANPQDVLREIVPKAGIIYSDEGDETVRRFRVRDIPLVRQPRQFVGRNIFVYGGEHVPE
ncbi:MAG: type I-E CRISPR-associated protein Cas5/CasD [Nitrospirae bacterium]|nr:type I-E CRISPR-associated protein Cas5/CasD [Nitrospirota bacterium]MBI5675617.1 type I-E CRISPR-associated protein Cas5/CasD [Nitrospirota bacterium]